MSEETLTAELERALASPGAINGFCCKLIVELTEARMKIQSIDTKWSATATELVGLRDCIRPYLAAGESFVDAAKRIIRERSASINRAIEAEERIEKLTTEKRSSQTRQEELNHNDHDVSVSSGDRFSVSMCNGLDDLIDREMTVTAVTYGGVVWYTFGNGEIGTRAVENAEKNIRTGAWLRLPPADSSNTYAPMPVAVGDRFSVGMPSGPRMEMRIIVVTDSVPVIIVYQFDEGTTLNVTLARAAEKIRRGQWTCVSDTSGSLR